MDHPGKVANPARGQLNREMLFISLSSFAPENLVWRDRFGRPVSRQPDDFFTFRLNLVLTLEGSSRIPRWRPFAYTINRHRVGSEFNRSHNCVPMAFTAESPPKQGQ